LKIPRSLKVLSSVSPLSPQLSNHCEGWGLKLLANLCSITLVSEHNRDVLLAFLNSTFREAGETPLTEIILLNPYTELDSPDDKQSIMVLKKAMDTLEFLSQDAMARMAYDARMKALSDEKTRQQSLKLTKVRLGASFSHSLTFCILRI